MTYKKKQHVTQHNMQKATDSKARRDKTRQDETRQDKTWQDEARGKGKEWEGGSKEGEEEERGERRELKRKQCGAKLWKSTGVEKPVCYTCLPYLLINDKKRIIKQNNKNKINPIKGTDRWRYLTACDDMLAAIRSVALCILMRCGM